MAKLKLTENTFTLMRVGEQALQVSKAVGKPNVNPKSIEITFVNEFGESISNSYTLDTREGKRFTVTSILLRAVFGNIEDFDTDDIPQMVGSFITAEIVHNEVESNKEVGKMLTFANMKNIKGGAEPFILPKQSVAVVEEDTALVENTRPTL